MLTLTLSNCYFYSSYTKDALKDDACCVQFSANDDSDATSNEACHAGCSNMTEASAGSLTHTTDQAEPALVKQTLLLSL